MSKRSLWFRRFLVAALVAVGGEQAWRHGHDYVFADQYAVVEPGKVYRGAWQKSWPMRRLIRADGLRTIVALAHPPEHPLSIQEKALAEEMGVRWVHIPIVDERRTGKVEGIFDPIERAAATIADPTNQPVYFHCHHGVNRASMVQMAYRMIYNGWSLDQATEEISRTFGLREVNHGPDYRLMAEFYQERVIPRRAEVARSREASPPR